MLFRHLIRIGHGNADDVKLHAIIKLKTTAMVMLVDCEGPIVYRVNCWLASSLILDASNCHPACMHRVVGYISS